MIDTDVPNDVLKAGVESWSVAMMMIKSLAEWIYNLRNL